MIRVRAETTKNMMERMVPYSEATGVLSAAYLQERRFLSRNRGPLFLSESDRNFAAPITIWTWSKVVKSLAERAGVQQLATHTPSAPLPDRSGKRRIGYPRNCPVCRSQEHSDIASVYPLERARTRSQD